MQFRVLLPQSLVFGRQFGYALAIGGDLLLLDLDLFGEHLYPGADLLVGLTHQFSLLGG